MRVRSRLILIPRLVGLLAISALGGGFAFGQTQDAADGGVAPESVIELGDPHASPSERIFVFPPFHPALRYARGSSSDVMTKLNDDLRNGTAALTFDPATGYLKAALAVLGVLPESQSVVFSRTSLQKRFISPRTPRAIFFNDDVSVGFIPGAPLLEIAVTGGSGTVFYAIEQRDVPLPQFARRDECLTCHISRNTLSIPGMLLRSMPTDAHGQIMPWLGNGYSDHSTPFEDRWAGWYVTGRTDRVKHLGNLRVSDAAAPDAPLHPTASALANLASNVDADRYPSSTSDIAALMVMTHQMHMTNLIVRAGVDARLLAQQSFDAASKAYARAMLDTNARAVVDYMLFVDEAPMEGPIQTSSAFAAKFESLGPFDERGRSLRHLQLRDRLLTYPCSYMIYSSAFVNLPPDARDAIYRRLWTVLSGAGDDARYRKLFLSDRRAIIEILRETKSDLPDYFKTGASR
jgi:hypothetical protein